MFSSYGNKKEVCKLIRGHMTFDLDLDLVEVSLCYLTLTICLLLIRIEHSQMKGTNVNTLQYWLYVTYEIVASRVGLGQLTQGRIKVKLKVCLVTCLKYKAFYY